MPTPSNSINEATTGIAGFTGTAFTATPVTAHDVLIGGATSSTIAQAAPSATSGVPLISQGAASDPAFGTAVVAGGGTGSTTFNTNGAVFSNTTTTGVLQAASLTDGQILIGSSAGAPAAATITAGSNITVTNGHNSISIAAAAGGISAGSLLTKFTASGTWTKSTSPPTVSVEVYAWGAGSGGGGGASASSASGGTGGACSGVAYFWGNAGIFGATETVTIGAGGGGGAGASGGGGAGSDGSTGGTSSIGNINTTPVSIDTRGRAGNVSSDAAQNNSASITIWGGRQLISPGSAGTGGQGKNNSGTAAADNIGGTGFAPTFIATGGGSGAGTNNSSANGFRGGNIQTNASSPSTILAGGTAGVGGAGGNGNNASSVTSGGIICGGTGGGGGAGTAAANAFNGGTGGIPGGGGGGGGSCNVGGGDTAGTGGTGGRGELWVIEYF